MKLPRILNSPLAATAGVLIGLALLAIPLHQLTSAPPSQTTSRPAPTETGNTPAWVTLKLLEPAEWIKLQTLDGKVLWSLKQIPAGDHETQLALPINDGFLEVTLEVKLSAAQKETAAFLTVAPDGLEQQTRHAIGSENLLELITFTWPTP